MNDSPPNPLPAARGRAWPGLAIAAVLAVFALITATSIGEWGRASADYAYNLQVEGFRAGHLSLNRAVPAGLEQLPDPYDPAANLVYRLAPYSLHDLSYYRGRLYLYFGVTPALVLFWPWVAATGHYLPHRYAAALFCGVGFLAAAGWLLAVRRRHFPTVGPGVAAAAIVALGLASGAPILLQRADVCEVPISCAYACLMLALAAVWRALADPERRVLWLGAASLACGLAVGARPSALFGTAILLVPLAAEFRTAPSGRRRRLLAAAALPLLACGLGLAAYNYLRFQNPLEFGEHYQLAGDRQDVAQHFSLRYLWFNFRVYFLAPVQWSRVFPFAHEIVSPVPPAGHAPIEDPFGILPNVPLAWLALAVPLAWQGRASAAGLLRGAIGTVAWVFATSAFVLALFYGDCSRYEFEFLPALVLLAAVGILALERSLAGGPAGRVARGAWAALLVFSVGFNLLESAEHHAIERFNLGNWLRQLGHGPEAVTVFRQAIAWRADYAEAHDNLGGTLFQLGRLPEAREELERSLRIRPASAEAHNNLANVLMALGERTQAITEYGEAARLSPADAALQYNWGGALLQSGRAPEAAVHYGEAIRLQPDNPEALNGRGTAWAQAGHPAEAEADFRAALRLRPDLAEAHFNLAILLQQSGRGAEAAEQYAAAVRLRPELGRPRP
jgi:tetratricopeptide (TPR) repeat protein